MSKKALAKIPTPKPVTIEEECSICELDWGLHPEDPTIEDCVALLKVEVLKKAATTTIVGCGSHHHCGLGHCYCYTLHYKWADSEILYAWQGTSSPTVTTVTYDENSSHVNVPALQS